MCKKLIYLVLFVLVLSVALTGTTKAELVGWWRFDEGSGTIAYDSSGNGNDGSFNGDPQWVVGNFGGALEFDGADDYVEVPDNESLHLWERFTLAAWIYQVESSSSRIIDKIGAGTANGPHLDTHPGTTLRSCSGTCVSTAVDYTLEEWHHVAVTFDAGDVKLYIDGSIEGEGIAPSPLAGNSLSLRIGADSDGQSLFIGLIDDARVYNMALTEGEILAVMEGAGTVYPYALGPNPADGTLHEDTWISLSWRAGDYAVSHDVYLGDNFDDVDAGAESTFQGNQTDTFLVAGFPGFAYPDGLVPGTTYYWRIDEVNDAEPNSPWKGDIWSFSIPPNTAYFPDPADNAESVSVDVTLGWTAGWGAKLHTVYFGETFEEVDNAAGGLPQGGTTYSPGELKQARTYYWRVDEFDAIETYTGDVWSFTTEGAVTAINPANGALDVTQTPVLTWAPGVFADTHEVYFGTDEASMELKSSGNLDSESFEPGELEWNTTYYWRVDEANSANADSPWTGPLWSFTTANFLIIDDMESYNDLDESEPGSNRIYLAWIDGFDNPAANGSVVGNLNAPFAEQTIVHSGNQSMPMAYDNAVGKSEATLTLTSNKDWTVNGVTTLTIWFRGASGNSAESLYVALNGGAPVTNDDPDAATRTSWTEWNIDLQAFGTNLANVNTITLGLSSVTGGAGMMYFDDIRLYPPAP
ncbi:MAG: LamG domain-containing protein [Sedimentisphaerales bacterium]|nr:LamG domain-containing protein [Sedimentisphaerales bacterium]